MAYTDMLQDTSIPTCITRCHLLLFYRKSFSFPLLDQKKGAGGQMVDESCLDFSKFAVSLHEMNAVLL
jgi:hypothetical protein